jgi:ADP-heptose:LPS heptosyltransferase
MKWKIFTWKEKAIYASSMLLSKFINANKNFSQQQPNRILCIKLDEIGDLCYSLHVFQLLKQSHPQAEITLLCKPFAVSLVAKDPNIDFATSHWNQITGYYDTIIDLRGNWKSMLYAIKNRPYIRLDRGTIRFKNKQAGKHPHEVYTNLQIISPLLKAIPEKPTPYIYTGKDEALKVNTFLQKEGLNNIAIFHTGARKQLRQWLPQNFAQLAIHLQSKYQLAIVFTGDQTDKQGIENIQKQIPFKTYNTAGLFNLSEFAALVKQSTLYVGNESGPLCIAAISGTKTLGLFGPGEPHVFYPYGDNTAYIHHVLDCNPCDQTHCVRPNEPCMQLITLSQVQLACAELLSK